MRLGSKTSKLEAEKFQIKIHVIGFGWKDLHQSWSEQGVDFSPEQRMTHLCDVIIPEQKKCGIPKEPKLELPSQKRLPQLEMKAAHVQELDDHYENEKETAIESAIQLRESLEADGRADRHEKMQPPRPEVNEEIIGLEIEHYGCLRRPMVVKCLNGVRV